MITLFGFPWLRTEFHLVPKQQGNHNYDLNLFLLNKIVSDRRPKTKKDRVSCVAVKTHSLENMKCHFSDPILAHFPLTRLLALFHNYEPRLEEYIVVYRISKFPLDLGLREFKNRHFAP